MTLEIITSGALLPFRHGFFSRKGGASSGVFSGLNCGFGSSDQSEIVAINRARVAQAMQVAPTHLVSVHQTHSIQVVTADGPLTQSIEADALVTNKKGLALAVLTADCQPVLFADQDNGVVGAAHAGWRGTLDGVLEATIDAMVAIGAARDKIAAVIGPAISQRNYEVGQEFLEQFLDYSPEAGGYFANGNHGKYLFDLPGYGLARLRAAGIATAQWTGHCTYDDAEQFFSYRRSCHLGEADYGRLISAISLGPT